MEQLIQRQRVKVAQWQEYPRIGLFLDELPNTPLPNIQQWFAESRGLGCRYALRPKRPRSSM